VLAVGQPKYISYWYFSVLWASITAGLKLKWVWTRIRRTADSKLSGYANFPW